MLRKHGLLGLAVILAVFAIAVGFSTLQVRAQAGGEICDNKVDDDDDKLVDCNDADCEEECGPSPCPDIELDLPKNDKHVSLCHFTGGGNVVLNAPSVSAFDPHTSHHGDCWKFFDGSTGCAP
jgi:hypothetical protein